MDNTDRLLNKIISVLLFTVLLIMLIIGSIFILPPSFALSSSVPYLASSSFNGLSSAQRHALIVDNGVNISINDNYVYLTTSYSSGLELYFGVVDNTIYFIAPYSGNVYSVYSASLSDASTYGLASFGSNVDITVDDINYSYASLTNTSKFGALSCYNSYDSIEDIIRSSSVSPTFSAERTITIEPGYVAYIETDGGTLDIIAEFPMLSRLSRPLWDSSVQIAFGVYYPLSGFTFTNNFGSSIDWLIPASAPTNLLGQSKIGGRSYTAGLPDDGTNVAIYNPAYSGLSSNSNSYGRAIKAPKLTVTISNCVFVSWYELRTNAVITPTSGPSITAGSDDNYISSVIYSPHEGETDTVVTDADCYYYDGSTNTTSAGVTMNAGGSNYGSNDIVEDSNNMLDNLEQKVTSLLSSPIRHITNLVNNATAFFTEIIHFFDWLPPEVRSVIVSCLALIPVIGFIKLLF